MSLSERIQSHKIKLKLDVEEGHKYSFQIDAYDIFGESKSLERSFVYDTTPPTLTNLVIESAQNVNGVLWINSRNEALI